MRVRGTSLTIALSNILFLLLAIAASNPLLATAQSTQQPIPATEAFDAPACSDAELGGITFNFPLDLTLTVPSPQRANPEWKAIITDGTLPPHRQPPKVLEGWVTPTPQDEKDTDQASAEVAEEDLP